MSETSDTPAPAAEGAKTKFKPHVFRTDRDGCFCINCGGEQGRVSGPCREDWSDFKEAQLEALRAQVASLQRELEQATQDNGVLASRIVHSQELANDWQQEVMSALGDRDRLAQRVQELEDAKSKILTDDAVTRYADALLQIDAWADGDVLLHKHGALCQFANNVTSLVGKILNDEVKAAEREMGLEALPAPAPALSVEEEVAPES
jgi:FtsZ-binding cell division protein ZapB